MRIVSKRKLREYWLNHNDCEGQLLTWYKETKKANWSDFEEVKQRHSTSKIIGSDRVVFKIKGNHHRLIVKVNFEYQIIWIRFIGTHSEYDTVDAKTV